jgi:radical SAM protein with 4Fe4S-binding SPASM domain
MAFVEEKTVPELPLWLEMREKGIPLSFELELTARCNNACAHCFINKPAKDEEALRRELSLEEIDRIADEAADLGALWCLVTGGEPLLREDFEEVYLLLRRKGFVVSVFTNACLVRERHVRLFREVPPRNVEVTVYGVTRETYEAVTKMRGSYDAFMGGLDMLQDAGVKVRLKAMAIRSNVHELDKIAAFCRARTKDFFRFDPLIHLRLDGDERQNEAIRAERLSPEEIVEIEGADPERCASLRDNEYRYILPKAREVRSHLLFRCRPGWGNFTVGHDGFFRPCASLRHPDCIYDLRRGTLGQAWHEVVPRVSGMTTDSKEYVEGCGACPYFNLCLWCPAHAYLETGQLDAHVPYFCAVAKARAEFVSSGKVKP